MNHAYSRSFVLILVIEDKVPTVAMKTLFEQQNQSNHPPFFHDKRKAYFLYNMLECKVVVST